MKLIRRLAQLIHECARRSSSPFSDDATWIPKILRVHTPLSVCVFVALLGGLIFLPRNEFFRQVDGGAPQFRLDWTHFTFWFSIVAAFWCGAIVMRKVASHLRWDHVERWGFHALQFGTVTLLLLATVAFAAPWNDGDAQTQLIADHDELAELGRSHYSPPRWDRTHVYIPIAVTFAGVAWLGMALRRRLFRRFRNRRQVIDRLPALIDRLIDREDRRRSSPAWRVSKGLPWYVRFGLGVVDRLSEFAFIVSHFGFALLALSALLLLNIIVAFESLAALGVPIIQTSNLGWVALVIVVIVFLLSIAFLNVAEHAAIRGLRTLRGAFLRNGAFLASAGLLIVVGTTLMDIKYISTVVLGAPQMVLKWFAFFYLLIWNFQYLIHIGLDLRLLDVINQYSGKTGDSSTAAEQQPTGGVVSGAATVSVTSQVKLSTEPGHYDIERFGISGFQKTRSQKPPVDKGKESEQLPGNASKDSDDTNRVRKDSLTQAPEKVEPKSIDEALRQQQHGGIVSRDELFEAMAGDPETYEAARRFQRDSKQYLATANLVLVFALAALFTVALGYKHSSRQTIVSVDLGAANGPLAQLESSFPFKPNALGSDKISDESQQKEARAKESAEFSSRLLTRVLKVESDQDSDQPVIVLAASGGGTRAALYTVSVLERLHRLNMLHRVRLMGGASGGCVALGYFLQHYDSLLQANPDDTSEENAWAHFYNAMQADYIVDSIRGFTQLRVPAGRPMGEQLSEAFARRWIPPKQSGAIKLFSQVPAGERTASGNALPGLVIVNTIVGISPNYTRIPFDPSKRVPDDTGIADSYHGGGRLLWTNFPASPLWFPGPDDDAALENQPLKAWRFDLITQAAVPLPRLVALSANFPPVFQNAGVRVNDKDGNLRRTYWITDGGTIDNRGVIPLMYALEGAFRESSSDQKPQKLILIVADASRVSNEYGHDNGLSAAGAAGTEVANQMIREKLQDLRAVGNNVHYYYLPMHHALRFDDMGAGFGTHWMPDWAITVRPIGESKNKAQTLPRSELVPLMRLLAGHADENASQSVQSAAEILKGNDKIWSKQYVRAVGHHQAWDRIESAFKDE